jgi:hypothetical protein
MTSTPPESNTPPVSSPLKKEASGEKSSGYSSGAEQSSSGNEKYSSGETSMTGKFESDVCDPNSQTQTGRLLSSGLNVQIIARTSSRLVTSA